MIVLNFTKPEWIKTIHKNYIRAGSDCIETNTFGSNKLKLDEFGLGDKTIEFNIQATKIAKQACSEIKQKSLHCRFNGSIRFSS